GRKWRAIASIGMTCAALAACSTYEQEEKSVYKVGRPYQVKGTWYYPKEEPDYDEVGQASWYGKRFHGLMTSNGERFDMNKLSAAHRTLPMPSLLRVTNVQNGRTVVVRLNDRGPFADDRILDVSRAAAERLGFLEAGVADVRVTYLGPAPLLGDEAASVTFPEPDVQEVQVASASETAAASVAMGSMIPAAPGGSQVQAQPVSLPSRQAPRRAAFQAAPPQPEPAPEPDPPARAAPESAPPAPAASETGEILFVQVASLTSSENASALKTKLESFGSSQVGLADINGRRFYRVRIGPMTSRGEAEVARARLSAAGYDGAIIVSQ
ncbi:MAG: septal ring lytic transglycosylase RlpA family protein, partial [Pseudomonadota bacterium]